MVKQNEDFAPGLIVMGVISDMEINSGTSQRTGRGYRMVTVWVNAGRKTFECLLSRAFGPMGSTAEYMEPVVGEDSAWYVEPRLETFNGISQIKLVLLTPALRPSLVSSGS